MKKKLEALFNAVKGATQNIGVYTGEIHKTNGAYMIEGHADGKFVGVLIVNERQMNRVLKVLNDA